MMRHDEARGSYYVWTLETRLADAEISKLRVTRPEIERAPRWQRADDARPDETRPRRDQPTRDARPRAAGSREKRKRRKRKRESRKAGSASRAAGPRRPRCAEPGPSAETRRMPRRDERSAEPSGVSLRNIRFVHSTRVSTRPYALPSRSALLTGRVAFGFVI